MPEQTYEKVAPADGDAYSDSSGSDRAGEQRNSTSSTQRRPRASADERRRDQETLNAEEEAERLLTGEDGAGDAGGLSAIFGGHGSARRTRGRFGSLEKREARRGGDDIRMIEQGGHRSASEQSSGNSSEVDLQRLVQIQVRRKVSILLVRR